MGLFGGLLGWEAEDERLVDSERALSRPGSGWTSASPTSATPTPTPTASPSRTGPSLIA